MQPKQSYHHDSCWRRGPVREQQCWLLMRDCDLHLGSLQLTLMNCTSYQQRRCPLYSQWGQSHYKQMKVVMTSTNNRCFEYKHTYVISIALSYCEDMTSPCSARKVFKSVVGSGEMVNLSPFVHVTASVSTTLMLSCLYNCESNVHDHKPTVRRQYSIQYLQHPFHWQWRVLSAL